MPRSLLLDRIGARRPRLSVILIEPTFDGVRSALEALRLDGVPKCQLIVAGSPASAAPAAIPGVDAIRLAMREGESLVALVNRASAAALGTLILLAAPGAGSALAAAQSGIARLEEQPDLGMVDSAGSLLTRADLWHALGGLDEDYHALPFALADLAMRARAIGFPAPAFDRGDNAVADFPGDAARLRSRSDAGPDRSRLPPAAERDVGRLVAYTTITDGYDVLKHQPRSATTDTEFVAFLDPATVAAHGPRTRRWRVAEFEPPPVGPQRASRWYKANAHLATDAGFSLWLDASVSVVFPLPLARLIPLFMGEFDLCVFAHHARQSVYEEAEACKERELDLPEVIDAQMERYRREGMPAELGLAEVPVILRRHSAAIRRFNETWWREIETGSRRDQLSFDYAAWKSGVSYARFPLSLATRNGLFLKFLR
ncbi:MAG: glycosyltransferase domain-containing protein [Bauldia sp.]